MSAESPKTSGSQHSPDQVSDREVQAALSSVMQQHQAATAPPPPAGRPWQWYAKLVLCVVLVATASILWVAGPDLDGASQDAPSPRAERASRRLAVYVMAGRIAGFRTENGRLPVSLTELGETDEGLRYTPLDGDAFELVARHPTDSVVYQSTQPMDELLHTP